MRRQFSQIWRILVLAAVILLLCAGGSRVTAQAPSVAFSQHTVADAFDGANSAWPADLDGDGDMDIVGSAREARDLMWWENDGSAQFSEHLIVSNFGAYATAVADLDGDEDLDIISVGDADISIGNPALAWWENNGSGVFTERLMAPDFYGRQAVGVDIDGDGATDIAAARYELDEVVWLQNDGMGEFTIQTVAAFDNPQGVHAADLDGDGHVDILAAGSGSDGNVVWWENDGKEEFAASHVLDGDFKGAVFVYAFDLDQDGDMDVLGAASEAAEMAWWENLGEKTFIKHTIDTEIKGAYSLYPADLNADGAFDLVGVSVQAQRVDWWENSGAQDFTRHLLDPVSPGPKSAIPADIDGNGSLDVVISSQAAGAIIWWQNVGPAVPAALNVTGLKPFYGRSVYTGAYDVLFVGFNGIAKADKQCSGSIDMIKLESLADPDYVIEEEFESVGDFTQEGSTVFIEDGRIVFDHLAMAGGRQFVYREIPPLDEEGGIRLTVRGQYDWWTSNCDILVGIGEKPDNSGTGISFGFYGDGCPNEGPYVGMLGAWMDTKPDGCSVTADSYPWISAGKPYTAVLTLDKPAETFSASGFVRDPGGSGIPGVSVIEASGRTALTDGAGRYMMADLAAGTYRLAPSKPRHTFSPDARTVTIDNANVTGQDFVSASPGSMGNTSAPARYYLHEAVPSGTVALFVNNETVETVTINIVGPPEGDVSCQAPAGKGLVLCSRFSAGAYSWQVQTVCGTASDRASFSAGVRTLTIRCPE
jgi:hypothetical protein